MKPRILLLYRAIIPSVILCAQVQLEQLAKEGKIEFRHTELAKLTDRLLNWSQIVVLVRGDTPLEAWIAQACRDTGRYVIYIMDDDLLHVPENFASGSHYNNPHVQQCIHRIMACCHCFASPSIVLLEKYGKDFEETLQLLEPVTCQISKLPQEKGTPVRIGFAGSVDRGGDLDGIVADALLQIKKHYGDAVSIEFFGPKTQIAKMLNAKIYPYEESYQIYQEKMKQFQWDIGLAPMPNTPFHACKYYNKLIEYCGFGIAGIYSKVPPYLDAVQDGLNGLLCDNTTADWVYAIRSLVDNDELRTNISKVSIDQARDRFSVNRAATMMASLVTMPKFTCCGEYPPIRGLQGQRWKYETAHYWQRLRFYGWKAPIAVIQKLSKRIRKGR